MNKRRRKRKLKKEFKISLIIILIIGLLSYPTYKLLTKEKTPTNEAKPNTEEKEEHYELSLIAVGDNLIHSSVYKDANKHANYNGYDFKPMITNIKEIVSNYDIGYYNQETILGGTELGLKDYPTFNSPYEAGDAMIDAGFNLVSLATNHTMDSGKKAVENSCKYWNSKENILTYCLDFSNCLTSLLIFIRLFAYSLFKKSFLQFVFLSCPIYHTIPFCMSNNLNQKLF